MNFDHIFREQNLQKFCQMFGKSMTGASVRADFGGLLGSYKLIRDDTMHVEFRTRRRIWAMGRVGRAALGECMTGAAFASDAARGKSGVAWAEIGVQFPTGRACGRSGGSS